MASVALVRITLSMSSTDMASLPSVGWPRYLAPTAQRVCSDWIPTVRLSERRVRVSGRDSAPDETSGDPNATPPGVAPS